jgi:hypothetical protein
LETAYFEGCGVEAPGEGVNLGFELIHADI